MEVDIQSLEIKLFGKDGGTPFLQRSVKSIALRHSAHIDAIIINGEQFGGNGGNLTDPINLAPDEHIIFMQIRHSDAIEYLRIFTNKGQILEGGTNGDNSTTMIGTIVTLGGRSGTVLDQLQVLGSFKSHSDSQYLETKTFGGDGGSSFSPRAIETIRLRYSSAINSININGQTFGSYSNGNYSEWISFAPDEYITKLDIRHTNIINYLKITTNKGQTFGGGGTEGNPVTVIGKITALGGRYGGLLDQLQVSGNFIVTQDSKTMTFGKNGGTPFDERPVQSIALRYGYRIDAITINGEQFGGNGGNKFSGPIYLAPDEYIAQIDIAHGDLIDYLKIITNKGRSVIGGSDGIGGTRVTLKGKITALGGRSGGLLDQLQVTGAFEVS